MLSRLNISIIIFLFLLFQPSLVFASVYGRSTYNSGKYSVGQEESTSVVSSLVNFIQKITENNSSSNASSADCSQTKPGSNPEIYQIDRAGSTVILFVNPGGDPYDSFFLSYGVGSNSDEYAAFFGYPNADGALKYDVHALSLNTNYSFKVQAMNGCAAGGWSNNMAVGKDDGTYTKYGTTQLTVKSKSVGSSVQKVLGITKTTGDAQQKTDSTEAPTVQNQDTKIDTSSRQTEDSAPKRWKIVDWFLNLFR